jgi:hypothetical protein
VKIPKRCRPERRRPWRPPVSRCKVCLREIDDLVKGVCADRAACEERQPGLFSLAGPRDR